MQVGEDVSSIGPSIDVRPQREEGFSERVFGDVHPLLGSFAALLFLSIILTGLIWARRMTLNRGAKSEYDWDEYSSEFDDDDEYEDPGEDLNVDIPTKGASVAAATQSTSSSTTQETDWVMGSDDIGGITTRLQMNGGTRTLMEKLSVLTDTPKWVPWVVELVLCKLTRR